MERPKLKREWVGLVVKSKVMLSNTIGQLPPGTRFMVTYSRGGLHLTSEPCRKCGMCLHISKVSEDSVIIEGRMFEAGDYSGSYKARIKGREAWDEYDAEKRREKVKWLDQ